MAQPVSLCYQLVSIGSEDRGQPDPGRLSQGAAYKVSLNIARDNASQGADQVVDLSRRSASDSISDTDAVNADCVNSLVQRQEIDKVGSERVFRRKSNFESLTRDGC